MNKAMLTYIPITLLTGMYVTHQVLVYPIITGILITLSLLMVIKTVNYHELAMMHMRIIVINLLTIGWVEIYQLNTLVYFTKAKITLAFTMSLDTIGMHWLLFHENKVNFKLFKQQLKTFK